MKRYVLLLIIFLNCIHIPETYIRYRRGKSLIINEKIGETIDPEEREYYDLYKGIENFKSAKLYHIGSNGYISEIVTDTLKLLAINADPYAVDILKDYIERYEEIKVSRDEFERAWNIIDHDDLGATFH